MAGNYRSWKNTKVRGSHELGYYPQTKNEMDSVEKEMRDKLQSFYLAERDKNVFERLAWGEQ